MNGCVSGEGCVEGVGGCGCVVCEGRVVMVLSRRLVSGEKKSEKIKKGNFLLRGEGV